MWNKISNISHPLSLHEALALKESGTAFFSGGSYLNLKKNQDITILIDINPLLSNEISSHKERIVIGAGTSLQQIAEEFPQTILSESIRCSCISKNTRNQRTIGGEVARQRKNSELLLLLLAMDVQVNVYFGKEIRTAISQWDGNGVITDIILDRGVLTASCFERFSLISSAPSFLIVASAILSHKVKFTIGGKVNRISSYETHNPPDDRQIENIIDKSCDLFLNDHYGSVNYKQRLVKTALKRLGDGKW